MNELADATQNAVPTDTTPRPSQSKELAADGARAYPPMVVSTTSPVSVVSGYTGERMEW